MLANFLNLAFNSAPSDNTAFGFVERTGLEAEPFLTDSLILFEGFLNDSANVA